MFKRGVNADNMTTDNEVEEESMLHRPYLVGQEDGKFTGKYRKNRS